LTGALSPQNNMFVSPKNETTIMPSIIPKPDASMTPKNDPLSTRQQPTFDNAVDLEINVAKLQPEDLKRYADNLKKFCK